MLAGWSLELGATDLQIRQSSGCRHCHLHYFMLQQNPEWFDILVPAINPGYPRTLAVKRAQ